MLSDSAASFLGISVVLFSSPLPYFSSLIKLKQTGHHDSHL